jgi:hypothetical protein
MNLTIQTESGDVICPISIIEKGLLNKSNNSDRVCAGYLSNFNNRKRPGK